MLGDIVTIFAAGLIADTNFADLPEFEKTANEVSENISKLMNIKGSKPVDYFHKRLGKVMWNNVGMARNEEGLKAAIDEIKIIREEFYDDVRIPGDADELNPELEKALRVADLIDLGQLMAIDALNRSESCGGHFREESQTEEGEALRDDENFMQHTLIWCDGKETKITYRPVHKTTLTNEVQYFPPQERVY